MIMPVSLFTDRTLSGVVGKNLIAVARDDQARPDEDL